MTIEIIGLSGKSGSGKDYIGRHILAPLGFKKWSFALPFKNEAVGAGYDYDAIHHQRPLPPAARQFLQVRGTEEGWHRHGRRYWCDIAGAWLRSLGEMGFDAGKIYFADVRFPHEVEWVQEQGGKVVRIAIGDRSYPLEGTPAAAHESETALDAWPDAKFDALVTNGAGRELASIRRSLASQGILGDGERTKAALAQSARYTSRMELPLPVQ